MGKRVIIIILAILIIDQIVKVWVKTTMAPHENISIIEGFFNLYYVENRGMAFGTTLGNSVWAKYALSLFRFAAIVAIAVYLVRLLKDIRVHKGLIYSMALIFAGATGNLIDGLMYDLIWPVNPDIGWNWMKDGNGSLLLDDRHAPIIRDSGFLLGSVVDMFQFTAKWPSYFPKGMAGTEIFGAIWNVADASISIGVGMIVLRYRTFFRQQTTPEDIETETEDDSISLKRWAVYFGISLLLFFVVLIAGSHLWYKIYEDVDPGIMSIAAIVVAFSAYWAMREYIKVK